MFRAPSPESELISDRRIETLDRWPVNEAVYLTLDLECDYGTALQMNTYEAASATPALVDLLEAYDVPVTCFVQTQLLQENPESIAPFEDASVPVEFHPHSHTHATRDAADVEFEVRESVQRVRERFETGPLGYRPPDGAFELGDYDVLERHGVTFNAGLFPSFRPGRFNNYAASRYPYRDLRTGVVELPFTVLSDRFRLPVSLSYLKLLGYPFERALERSFPSVIVFDMHMHDLVTPPAYEQLPPLYRGIYARGKNDGLATLERFVRTARRHGARFGTMSELYVECAKALSNGGGSSDDR